jgi:plastocyanin
MLFISFGKILIISAIVSFLFSFWVLANTMLNLSIKTVKTENQVFIVEGAVNLGNESYKPNPINITKGDTITWINNDIVIHTVTSGSANSKNIGKIFDSGLIRPGDTFNFTVSNEKINNTSIIDYFCEVHPSMVAKIYISSKK